MKKTDNILKQFLHLKEDYTLDLNKEKEDSQIIVEDDKSENKNEEKEDVESVKETDDTESTEKTKNTSSEEKTEKEKEDKQKESSKDSGLKYTVDITPIYEKMQAAKTPVDVAFTLKEFLDKVEEVSIDALTQKGE